MEDNYGCGISLLDTTHIILTLFSERELGRPSYTLLLEGLTSPSVYVHKSDV